MHGADAARRLEANPISFEVQRVSEALGLHPHELEEAGEGLLEPVKKLSGRISGEAQMALTPLANSVTQADPSATAAADGSLINEFNP